MKKITLTVILFIGCLQYSFGQTDDGEKNEKGKEKIFDQYIGVQLNDLIRQVFNFNNTAAPNTNPYLLNYSINMAKTGWGARIGVGYNYNTSSSDDGITKTDTKLNDLVLRVGLEKAFKLSKKWSAGAGLDFVYSKNNDHTTSIINSSFGGQSTETNTTISSSGGGPMGWLRYHITEKIQIGTEASFYYASGKQNQTVIVTDPSNPVPPVSTPSSTKVGSGTFTSPVVFFLSVKF